MMTEEYGDRRSPVIFEAKKVCMDVDNSDSTTVVIGPSSGIIHAGKVSKPKKIKSVRFNEQNLAEIIEFEDDIESKNARKLYWETVAADRFRFKDRIQRLEEILSPVLSSKHRNVVYTHRVITPNPATLPIFGCIFQKSTTLVEEVRMTVIQQKLETSVHSLLQFDPANHFNGIGAAI
ncbi:unnamed protein product [Orchesella dallaii]|uniref:Uncharacterized protein n=1 Tax=Orchesella dallaii TaxID=48710 RepID=A0ABP1QWX6_9HEXA